MRKLPSNQKGLSLLEVLVSIVVLAIGLLGLAGLQATSLKSGHSAYLRSQATVLAYDIADRMRTNTTAAVAGAYDVTDYWDREDWEDLVTGLLGDDATATLTRNGGSVTIQLQWNDTRGAIGATDTVMEVFTYSTEIFR